MSAEPYVLEIQGVSKRYSRSLRRSLWYGIHDIGKEVVGRGQYADALRPTEFWALRDVSFAVSRGETVGLIGHNGAGKTTLLKLINGLIKPTTGRISVRGSIRALIALDAGFNPILTGRENVKVASTLLGVKEGEIEERLERIVEFSEIGDFIDAPVRSYSTGMVARLGFSVAVHTQPDILLVDEVLAVGDLNFAIKCHRKIKEFRDNGGSIVLVSHNAYAIRSNCDRVVWIEHGEVQDIGPTAEICDAYEAAVARQDAKEATVEEYSDGAVTLTAVRHPDAIESGEPFSVEVQLEVSRPLEHPIVALSFSTLSGEVVVASTSEADRGVGLEVGGNVVQLTYDKLPLTRGIYSISVVVAEEAINNQVLAALNRSEFEVRVPQGDLGAGVLHLQPSWSSGDSVDAAPLN